MIYDCDFILSPHLCSITAYIEEKIFIFIPDGQKSPDIEVLMFENASFIGPRAQDTLRPLSLHFPEEQVAVMGVAHFLSLLCATV